MSVIDTIFMATNFEEVDQEDPNLRRRGGVSVAFPVKLHAVLDQVATDGLAHVVSWMPHGRCFVIHDPKEFVDHIMPRYVIWSRRNYRSVVPAREYHRI